MTATDPAPARPRKLSPEVRRSLTAIRNGTASEKDLQRCVIAYGKDHGWLVHHSSPAQVKDRRWVTPVWGHPGHPDTILLRPPRLVIAELKAPGGATSDMQDVWIDRYSQLPGTTVEVYIWWPRDWRRIRDLLR